MELRRTVNHQTRDDKFVMNKGEQAIFTPTQETSSSRLETGC